MLTLDSDSVNLGSNPSSPARANIDVHCRFPGFLTADKSDKQERKADIGRTDVGTAFRGQFGHVSGSLSSLIVGFGGTR